MKKNILLILALVMMSLAACGSSNSPASSGNDKVTTPSSSQKENEDPAQSISQEEDESTTPIISEEDIEAVLSNEIELEPFSEAAAAAFWLQAAGVDEAAAVPDWDWVIDESKMMTYGDTIDSAYGHGSICFEKADGGEISEEEFQAWAQKLFTATAAASDDGHNIIGWEFTGEGENGLSEVAFEEAVDGGFMQGWGFMKNGRNMVVYLDEVYDTGKDSAIGRELYYYGVKADIAFGLEMSLDDALGEAEQYFEENEEEIEKALDEYFN
jgi:hypothetical protein